jgi:dinuclear metal center YbgI/SA1388 family protein
MAARVTDILAALEAKWPRSWALPDDPGGLQVGDPEKPVARLLVALEAGDAVVGEAEKRGAGLLLTHHPLLYRPLAEIREDQGTGSLVARIIRAGLAAVSCHTNLDVAPGGLNDHLARLLGLTQTEPLAAVGGEASYKLAVFVPVGYEEKVRQALFAEGAGIIGHYSHCSFAARGQGTYLPSAGARPFKGEVGALSRAEESRLEVLVPESRLNAVVAALKQAHPYEEAAFDLYPLKNSGPPLALGRVGNWPEPLAFDAALDRLKEAFQVPAVRVWGRPPVRVDRVAVLGGSGGDLAAAAHGKGARLYVTGEVRHHQAAPWHWEDFAIAEVGHFASEIVFMPVWAEQLRELFG